VVARLTMKVEPTPKLEECGKREPGYTRSYKGVWRWDPAKQKYCQTSGNLNKLYKFYERYSGSPYPAAMDGRPGHQVTMGYHP